MGVAAGATADQFGLEIAPYHPPRRPAHIRQTFAATEHLDRYLFPRVTIHAAAKYSLLPRKDDNHLAYKVQRGAIAILWDVEEKAGRKFSP